MHCYEHNSFLQGKVRLGYNIVVPIMGIRYYCIKITIIGDFQLFVINNWKKIQIQITKIYQPIFLFNKKVYFGQMGI